MRSPRRCIPHQQSCLGYPLPCCDPCDTCYCRFFNAICYCRRVGHACPPRRTWRYTWEEPVLLTRITSMLFLLHVVKLMWCLWNEVWSKIYFQKSNECVWCLWLWKNNTQLWPRNTESWCGFWSSTNSSWNVLQTKVCPLKVCFDPTAQIVNEGNHIKDLTFHFCHFTKTRLKI